MEMIFKLKNEIEIFRKYKFVMKPDSADLQSVPAKRICLVCHSEERGITLRELLDEIPPPSE